MITFAVGAAMGAGAVLGWRKVQASNTWLRALRVWAAARSWFTAP